MKKNLALLLSVLLIASLAACGNGDAVPEQPAENATTTTSTTADAPTADTSDTTASVTVSSTADTTAEKTTSATGKPQSTAETKQPTVNKTQSTKVDITKSTTAKTTVAASTTQSTAKPTKSTTKRTTAKTDPTAQTTATTQSHYNDDEFDWNGNTIVVETPTSFGDALPIYFFSAKLPEDCSVTDECAPVLLSYGHMYNPSTDRYPEDDFMFLDTRHFKYVDFKIISDNGEEILLNSFAREDFITLDYYVDLVFDENRRVVDYIYAHTETIQLPLSLCTKESGRISFSLRERFKNGEHGSGGGVSVYYKRTDTEIRFSVVNEYGQKD